MRLPERERSGQLTSFHEGSQAGAISDLLKGIGPAELADAIRVAACLLHISSGRRAETINPCTMRSEREQELLKLIAEGMAKAEIDAKLVVSEKQIIETY